MPIYAFTARRTNGDSVSGTETATDRRALERLLSSRGLLLVSASRERSGVALSARRVGVSAKLGLVREFRHLLQAGMGVAPALEILRERPASPALSEAVGTLLTRLREGTALEDAAAARPDVFDPAFRAALGVGQRTGRLAEALERYSGYLAMQAELRRKVRRALAYPAFLLVLLIAVLAVLMIFVLPRFAELYADFGTDLPLATRILVASVEAAPVWVPAMLAALVFGPLALRWLRRTGPGKRALDQLALAMPLAGQVTRDVALVQVSYMLSSLLRSGAPMQEALSVVQEGIGNTAMRARVAHVATLVAEGKSFADAVETAGLFPPLSHSMVRAGDAAGALPELLDAVSRLHEQQAEDRMASLLALIEPTTMVIVGLVLGAVVVSVYLPIFGISGVVQ